MANTLNTRKISKGDSQWSFFLPFAFLFAQYEYGLGSVMLTYCILFMGYCIIKYREFPVFKPLSVYTIWYVLILLSTVVLYGHAADRAFVMKLFKILISGFCVIIVAKHVDKDSLYRNWKVLGMIVCAVIAFQFFQIFILHHSVLPIRLLPVSSGELMRNDNWTTPSDRPVAFFTEPAMVVTYLIPVLFFAQQKKDLLVSIIVSISILLTGSTSGIMMLIIMWGLSFFSYKFSRTAKIFMVVIAICAVIAFLNLSFFSQSLEKLTFELSGDSGNMDVRMLRGYWVYGVLDVRSQLLGISDYDIASYVYGNASEFTMQTVYEDNFYLNTIQRILIQTGALGALIYIWMLIQLWRSTYKEVQPYLAVVIVSMFFASHFYINGMFVMQFIILLSYLKKFDEKMGEKVRIKSQRQYVPKTNI